jgi:hypothetical protein
MEEVVKGSGGVVIGRALLGWGIVVLTAVQLGVAGLVRLGNVRVAGELDAAVLEVRRLEGDLQQSPLPKPVDPLPVDPQTPFFLASKADVVVTLQVVQGLGDSAGDREVLAADGASTHGLEAVEDHAGRGTPEQVCQLLASIERQERLLVVESGRIVPTGTPQVSFEFGIAVYHATEER